MARYSHEIILLQTAYSYIASASILCNHVCDDGSSIEIKHFGLVVHTFYWNFIIGGWKT